MTGAVFGIELIAAICMRAFCAANSVIDTAASAATCTCVRRFDRMGVGAKADGPYVSSIGAQKR